MTISLRPPLRLTAVLLLLPVVASVACDVEDTAELEAGIEADSDDISDEGNDTELDVPELSDGLGGGSELPLGAVPDVSLMLPPGFLSFHSEETAGAAECPVHQIVTGFACDGSYCDNVSIRCQDRGGSVPFAFSAFSPWFEVGPPPGFAGNPKTLHKCDPGHKMTGIDCRGSYCDDISIECSPSTGLATNNCRWSPQWFSEEAPSEFLAPAGSSIQGVACWGTHCDNKKFWLCDF